MVVALRCLTIALLVPAQPGRMSLLSGPVDPWVQVAQRAGDGVLQAAVPWWGLALAGTVLLLLIGGGAYLLVAGVRRREREEAELREGDLREQIVVLDAERAAAKEEAATLTVSLEEARQQLSKLKAYAEKAGAKLIEARNMVVEANQAATESKVAAGQSKAAAEALHGENRTLKEEADKARSQADHFRAQAEQARAEVEQMREELEQAHTLAEEATRLQEESNALIEKARLRVEEVEQDRADLEDEKKRLAEESARTVQATQRHLMSLRRQLVEAERGVSQGRYLAGLMRDLHQPMALVRESTDLTAELLAECSEVIQRLARVAGIDAVSYLADIFDNLLVTTRKSAEHIRYAESGIHQLYELGAPQPAVSRPANMHHLVTTYVDLVYQDFLARAQGVRVVLERNYDPEIGTVNLVPREIGHVLIHLLDNAFAAVLAMHKKAGSSYVPKVLVRTVKKDEAVEVWVADNGIGISQEQQARVFEPFYTTKHGGAGIGLALSREIVARRYGGRLTVDSDPGSYTAFKLMLPVHRVQLEETAPSEA